MNEERAKCPICGGELPERTVVFADRHGPCSSVDPEKVVCEKVYTAVYLGWMSDIERRVSRELKWNSDPETLERCGDFGCFLTLKEISDQLNAKYEFHYYCVYVDDPFCGTWYAYGNHGEFWEKVGETCGYA